VNTEQEIRAAAASATARLMCTAPPAPGDFIAMSGVIEAYIRDGQQAAFALCGLSQEVQQAPRVEESEPQAGPVASPPPRPEPQPEPAPVVEPEAEVIPLAARGQVSSKQEGARRIIEKQRKARVDALVAQATVAKAKAHKQRILDEAEENRLTDYPIVINGEPITLGAYLASVLGS
jgi:hypothetical protein